MDHNKAAKDLQGKSSPSIINTSKMEKKKEEDMIYSLSTTTNIPSTQTTALVPSIFRLIPPNKRANVFHAIKDVSKSSYQYVGLYIYIYLFFFTHAMHLILIQDLVQNIFMSISYKHVI